MVLDYDTTRLWLRKRYGWLSDEDFEDRYHDTWLEVLEKGLKSTINPLTAFKTMFHTWAARKQERRRVQQGTSLIRSVEPTVFHMITDGWYQINHFSSDIDLFDGYFHTSESNDLVSLIERSKILERMSDFQYEVFKHKLEGYSFDEMAIELNSTAKSCENAWRKKTVDPLKIYINSIK